MERRQRDDRVYWHGRPENPQPQPKAASAWVLIVLTIALGALVAWGTLSL